MPEIGGPLLLYAMFAIPAIATGLPPWSFVSRQVRLGAWDALQLVAPCIVWWVLVVLHGGNKSLSNLIELPLLGALTGLAFAGCIALAASRPGMPCARRNWR